MRIETKDIQESCLTRWMLLGPRGVIQEWTALFLAAGVMLLDICTAGMRFVNYSAAFHCLQSQGVAVLAMSVVILYRREL